MQHGTYLILNIDETISSDGYIQTMKLLKNPGSLVSSETKVNSNNSTAKTMSNEEIENLARTNALNIAKPILDMQAKAISEFEEAKRIYDLTPHDSSSWLSKAIDSYYNQASSKIEDWKKNAAELGYSYNSSNGGGGGSSF